jgi:hypothetical protein
LVVEKIDDIDTLLYLMADQLENYVYSYKHKQYPHEDDCRHSAYEIVRWMKRIDSEVGSEAVAYLRDNGL